MVNKVWTPVFGYEDCYEICVDTTEVRGIERDVDRGVKGILTIPSRIIVPQLFIRREGDMGYFKVGLRRDNKRRYQFVHRLMALTFLPNPNNLPQVNHKDGNKHNNTLENLEWVNNSQNVLHAVQTGLRIYASGESLSQSKLTEPAVREIRALNGKERPSKVGRDFGISATHVNLIWAGKSWKHIL